MQNSSNYKAAMDMLYLCGCAIGGIKPASERIASMELGAIYKISVAQNLTALVGGALEPCREELSMQNDELTAILTVKERSVRKNLMFATERQKLISFMESEGIWYMSLKGIVLQELYPKMGLRQMSDNDILFDPSCREQVRDWFASEGYEVRYYGISNHDVYQKKPIYNFEMHVDLFDEAYAAPLSVYYRDVKARLVPIEGSRYGYRFSYEDLYCYFVCHAYKHWQIAGIGFRFLCDLWVMLKAYRDTMDWEYIGHELLALGVSDFEAQSRALADAVFTDITSFSFEALSPSMQQHLVSLLSSGTYGTQKQLVTKGIAKKGGKFKYLLSCVFPGASSIQTYFPACIKHPWLLPVGWFWRLMVLLFKRSGYVCNKLKYVFSSKKNDK